MIRGRQGMSLVEVLVAIAIMLALAVVMVPAFSQFFQLEQRRCAQELATSYAYMHDEAVMQNVTFRIAYHIDEGFYEIQSGATDTLIFDDPDKRAEWEHDRDFRMRLLSEEAKAAKAQEEAGLWAWFGEAPVASSNSGNLPMPRSEIRQRRELPSGTVFGGVYTPQYDELVTPDARIAERDGPRVVYSHIFSNGFTEESIIQIADVDDPTTGYTIHVEPLSGKVSLKGGLLAVEDLRQDVPDEAPELP